MELRFTRAARKHRIGRASVRHVISTATPTEMITTQGNHGWRYVGRDERDRELEVFAVEIAADPEAVLLVIHVMPTHLRGSDPDA